MPDTPDIRFFSDSVEGRRGEIFDAALTVFHRRGYDAGTMREIADAVGVSEPALYRHFAGKEDLFEQLIAEAGRRVVADVIPLLEATVPERVEDVLSAVAANRHKAASAYLPVFQTIAIASVHNERFLEVYRNAFTTPIVSRLDTLVRDIDAAHGIVVADTEHAERVRALVSLFVGYLVTSFVLGGSDDSLESIVMRAMGWD